MADNFKAGYDSGVWFLVMDALQPSNAERNSFRTETPLEIRFSTISNAIFFSIKYPGEPPCDAPFTPHWYDPKPFVLVAPDSRLGYKLIYALIPHGEKREIELPYVFSSALYDAVISAYEKPYDKSAFEDLIGKTYNNYTPEQLWELAPINQRCIVGTEDKQEYTIIPDNIKYAELIKYAKYVSDVACLCVYCVPNCLRNKANGKNPHDYEVPIPLKYIREIGYAVENGVVYVDAPYDDIFGLKIDNKYYE